MQYLQKIIISNARRFGKKIEIEVGQGATIILAPNGTGKTTVFEAIEFALTGTIQRLPNPPLSLIRDNEEGLDIRLEFEDEKYCEVVYKKDNEIELRGFHSELFGNHDISEIPFLLRLTHLLEQRGTTWFVQQENEENAGGLLDRLSIGTDLLKINSNKTSISKAATAAVTTAKDNELKAREELANFMTLVNRRNALRVEFVLVPLGNILRQLTEIYKATNAKSVKTEEEVNPLLGFAGQVDAAVTNYLAAAANRLTQFSKVENLIEVYAANENKIVEKTNLLKRVEDSTQIAKIDVNKTKAKFDEENEKRNKARKNLDDLNELKKNSDSLAAEIGNEEALNKQLSQSTETLPEMKVTLEQIKGEINKLQALIEKHRLLKGRESAVLVNKGNITILEPLADDWKKQEAIMVNSSALLSTLQGEKDSIENAIKTAEEEAEKAEKLLEESSNTVNALKNASNTILAAVGIIATNLPKDEGKCPVCTASYHPDELHDRMKKALEEISPVLRVALKKMQELQNLSDNKKLSLSEFKQQLEKLIEKMALQQDSMRNATQLINKVIQKNFPGSQNYSEALNWIVAQKTSIESEVLKIADERKLLEAEPGQIELETKKNQQSQLDAQIQSMEKELREVGQKLTVSKERIEFLKLKIGTNEIGKINIDIIEAEKILKNFNEEIDRLQKKQEEIEKIVADNNKMVVAENGLLAQLKGQQSEIQSNWEQASLDGLPLTEELINKREKLQAEEKDMLKNKIILEKIKEDLARWKTAEQYEQHNKEIIQLTGSLSEEDFQRRLNDRVKMRTNEWEKIEEKKKTLNSLFTNVANELKAVHDYIKAINPLWSSFLKRVVVNPRFADISLESSTYRNKTHAGVKVDLHKNKVKVSEVASEAQITDLQLTFMLSMAQTHKWTSWKGLLMDDPTQHHDLVHAAGVFDLLRDQIIDNKFQVLLGTHDSVQARFFQRKLQNDGVPVRIWNLIADDHGVKAERIE